MFEVVCLYMRRPKPVLQLIFSKCNFYTSQVIRTFISLYISRKFSCETIVCIMSGFHCYKGLSLNKFTRKFSERWRGILPSEVSPIAAVDDDPFGVLVEDS